jgi:hypothetical protein
MGWRRGAYLSLGSSSIRDGQYWSQSVRQQLRIEHDYYASWYEMDLELASIGGFDRTSTSRST